MRGYAGIRVDTRMPVVIELITFPVRRSRGEMYIGLY